MTAPSLRIAVLTVLSASEPYALPHPQLLAEVNRLVRPAITSDQLKEILSWLIDKVFVDFLTDPLDPDNAEARRWFIREAGSAQLRR